MSTKRIRHTAKFKFQIAVEAIQSDKTINQLASEHQLQPSQISQWKKQLLEQGSDIFAATPTKGQREQNDRPRCPVYCQCFHRDGRSRWLCYEYEQRRQSH